MSHFSALKVTGRYIFKLFRGLKVIRHNIFQLLKALKITYNHFFYKITCTLPHCLQKTLLGIPVFLTGTTCKNCIKKEGFTKDSNYTYRESRERNIILTVFFVFSFKFSLNYSQRCGLRACTMLSVIKSWSGGEVSELCNKQYYCEYILCFTVCVICRAPPA